MCAMGEGLSKSVCVMVRWYLGGSKCAMWVLSVCAPEKMCVDLCVAHGNICDQTHVTKATRATLSQIMFDGYNTLAQKNVVTIPWVVLIGDVIQI